jgi:hypothetical protein
MAAPDSGFLDRKWEIKEQNKALQLGLARQGTGKHRQRSRKKRPKMKCPGPPALFVLAAKSS